MFFFSYEGKNFSETSIKFEIFNLFSGLDNQGKIDQLLLKRYQNLSEKRKMLFDFLEHKERCHLITDILF